MSRNSGLMSGNTSNASQARPEGLAAQRPLYQVHGMFGGRQASAFGSVCGECGINRVWRDEFA
jgi:hypothetical protein